ncbi:hypothetical protein EVC37_20785 [Methylocaldum sp. BRCS4]|nr:hypothetical protein [Methylocaldum sp. BRCS4]
MDIHSIFPARRGMSGSWGTGYCRMYRLCGWLWILPLLAGCAASPIAESWRQAATNQPSFAEISADPESFRGQTVILGGKVAAARVLPSVTEIEVWQKPLDSSDRPKEKFNASQSRFLVRCLGSLNSADYFPGRLITVAGEIQEQAVQDAEIRPLGRFHYIYPAVRYPVIDCGQVHVWPQRWELPDVYVPPYRFGPREWRGTGYAYPYYYQPYQPFR